jgi:glycosyltransferase involved in cell wall biosynthesis
LEENLTSQIILVSILVPNYNKAPYLARAVRSALCQTFSNLELVISDDYSSDLGQESLAQFELMDPRVRIRFSPHRVFSNWNRAKCICLARACCVSFLDSDDELMNQTVEIDSRAHKLTGADMVEHKVLQVRSGGRISIFQWREAPFHEADNVTLTAALRKETMNWTLWRKMIGRHLYARALVFLGLEACQLQIVMAEDRLHATALYRFVRKFVTVDYFGYLYYPNIFDNSWHRMGQIPSLLSTIEKLVTQMASRQIADSVDNGAVCRFCAGIQEEIPELSCKN